MYNLELPTGNGGCYRQRSPLWDFENHWFKDIGKTCDAACCLCERMKSTSEVTSSNHITSHTCHRYQASLTNNTLIISTLEHAHWFTWLINITAHLIGQLNVISSLIGSQSRRVENIVEEKKRSKYAKLWRNLKYKYHNIKSLNMI